MTKRASEGAFGEALRRTDLRASVYKPPDDARNWKPCDYMVWYSYGDDFDGRVFVRTAWFECKDIDAVETFPLSELRPSQLRGLDDAYRVGIPYFLAVYWRRHRLWTISDLIRFKESVPEGEVPTKISRNDLMTRFGIESTPAHLTSTLKAVLLGEV